MGLDHLLLLAAIQGITEFIPVSSSGHLQLVHGLTAFPDHGLAVDVALHAGTLLAVMAYFYRDVGLMLVGARDIVRRQPSAPAHLVRVLVIASLPVLLAGATLVVLGVTDALRKPEIVAWASIVFAIPLWLADAGEGGGARDIVGLAQMLALIPGASRAGVIILWASIWVLTASALFHASGAAAGASRSGVGDCQPAGAAGRCDTGGAGRYGCVA